MSDTDKYAETKKRYEGKRAIKSVSFNLETEKEIFDYAEKLDFSNWVKARIQGDIEAEKYKKE